MLLFKHTDNFSLCHAAPVNQSNQLNCSQMLQIKYKLYLTAWWAIKGAANRTRSRKEEQRLTYWISEAPAPCCLLLWHWDNWHQNRLKALRSSLPHSLTCSLSLCVSVVVNDFCHDSTKLIFLSFSFCVPDCIEASSQLSLLPITALHLSVLFSFSSLSSLGCYAH